MNPDESRPYVPFGLVSQVGRTRWKIECPYCGQIVVGYLWSLAGSGKRCPECGALHKMDRSYKSTKEEG